MGERFWLAGIRLCDWMLDHLSFTDRTDEWWYQCVQQFDAAPPEETGGGT